MTTSRCEPTDSRFNGVRFIVAFHFPPDFFCLSRYLSSGKPEQCVAEHSQFNSIISTFYGEMYEIRTQPNPRSIVLNGSENIYKKLSCSNSFDYRDDTIPLELGRQMKV